MGLEFGKVFKISLSKTWSICEFSLKYLWVSTSCFEAFSCFDFCKKSFQRKREFVTNTAIFCTTKCTSNDIGYWLHQAHFHPHCIGGSTIHSEQDLVFLVWTTPNFFVFWFILTKYSKVLWRCGKKAGVSQNSIQSLSVHLWKSSQSSGGWTISFFPFHLICIPLSLRFFVFTAKALN